MDQSPVRVMVQSFSMYTTQRPELERQFVVFSIHVTAFLSPPLWVDRAVTGGTGGLPSPHGQSQLSGPSHTYTQQRRNPGHVHNYLTH